MDKQTADTHWRTVLIRQGRSFAWLADVTGKKRRTVYAYSAGTIKNPPREWLAKVSDVLGQEVTA
jgi:predicted transcriptional regulator